MIRMGYLSHMREVLDIRIFLPILLKWDWNTQRNAKPFTNYDTRRTDTKWVQQGITPTNSFGRGDKVF
jgi:hypothetical protein